MSHKATTNNGFKTDPFWPVVIATMAVAVVLISNLDKMIKYFY